MFNLQQTSTIKQLSYHDNVPFLSRNPFSLTLHYSHFLNHSMVLPLSSVPKPFGYLALPIAQWERQKKSTKQVHIFKTTRTAFQRAWPPPNPPNQVKVINRENCRRKSVICTQAGNRIHFSGLLLPNHGPQTSQPTTRKSNNDHNRLPSISKQSEERKRKGKKKASLQSKRLSVLSGERTVPLVSSLLRPKRPQSVSFLISLHFALLSFPGKHYLLALLHHNNIQQFSAKSSSAQIR